MKKIILILLLSLLCAFSAQAKPKSLAFAPVIDYSALNEVQDAVILRNAIIAELTEGYDCLVLCRSNGIPILEEQRRLAYSSSDPANFPYPPAADYLLVIECLKESDTLRLRVGYTAISGDADSELKTFSMPFASTALLKATAADQVVAQLAEELSLTERPTIHGGELSADDLIWAVLPFQELSAFSDSGLPLEVQDLASEILAEFAGGRLVVCPAAGAGGRLLVGACEMLTAAGGRSLGADFVVTGALHENAGKLTMQLFMVRSSDALVIAAREFIVDDMSELEAYLNASLSGMVKQIKPIGPLLESAASANLEEARILYEIADDIYWRGKTNLWHQTQALGLFLAARMVAQDSFFEQTALNRIPVILHRHPNSFYYRDKWRTAGLSKERSRFNEDVIAILEETVAALPASSKDEILLHAYNKSGLWEAAYSVSNRQILQGKVEPGSSDRAAADYLRILSLTERNEEAVTFFDSLNEDTVGNFTFIQAGNHFRRVGDEDREMENFEQCIESGSWRTRGALGRLCELLEEKRSPERQIELLNQLRRSWRSDPRVQWQLIKAEVAMGQTKEARERAAALLKRNELRQAEFSSEADFKAELRRIAGATEVQWLTAREIRAIPDNYKMYLQPVGDVDLELIENAAAIASEFFGVVFVVWPTIPAPESRTVFKTDLLTYRGIPLLRHLVTARPPPADAINQLFVVDRRFLIYGRGDTVSLYRLGLGTMISSALVQEHVPANKQARRLSSEIIRHFRYFVERSQDIFLNDSPNQKPCINESEWVKRQPEHSYCPLCVRNYKAADWETVHAFVQALPQDLAFEPDYVGARYPITEAEKKSIREYAESLN